MTTALLRHPLPAPVDPAQAFSALLADTPWSAWFDDHGERGRGMSYLAWLTPIESDAENFLERVRLAHRALPTTALPAGLPLGVLLVLPYEWAGRTLELDLPGEEPPVAAIIERVIAVDHRTGEAVAYGLGLPDERWDGFISEITSRLAAAPPPPPPVLPHGLPATWRDTPGQYRDVIAAAQAAIREGEAYQLCVTTRITIDGSIDPVELHRVLRVTNPTHHQALLRLGGVSFVSASPETFLDISGEGIVTTRPIKGTRPRGATPESDAVLARELLESDKERAENLMIVDLMRNDLSRVCVVGSVDVPELLVVETYSSVHQLVSTIRGTLRDGVDVLDVIDAAFPAGSMTGAPKHRAVELLAGWESGPRGYYSGVYGLWRADGSATLAMTIRTALVGPAGLRLGVGGGITALSDPSLEIAEVGVKALPILRALGISDIQYS